MLRNIRKLHLLYNLKFNRRNNMIRLKLWNWNVINSSSRKGVTQKQLKLRLGKIVLGNCLILRIIRVFWRLIPLLRNGNLPQKQIRLLLPLMCRNIGQKGIVWKMSGYQLNFPLKPRGIQINLLRSWLREGKIEGLSSLIWY